MRAESMVNLINIGATDTVRQHLKRMSLKERLPALHALIPYVKETQLTLEFFRKNFSQEIGALISAEYNYERAESLYNTAKGLLRSKKN
jgi:hypothetical protein